METVRYVQAADLHLDAPFTGIARKCDEELAAILKNATLAAMENLVRLCEKEKPDFLLLAGDIYNQEDRSVKAQLRLRDLCARLDSLGIMVFICHGNHDPWNDRLSAISWPANVVIFGPEVSQAAVLKNGEPIALVHGASHADGRESRNLAKLFHRDQNFAGFQIGLLHCNVDRAVDDRYAPCSLQDLRDSGLDAWALGHVHERRTLSEHPLVIYPGNTQGLRASENGPKGCYLVTATYNGGWEFDARFVELSPVEWLGEDVDMEGAATLDEVADRLQAAIAKATAHAATRAAIILTLRMIGRTPLDSLLHQKSARSDLISQIEPPASQKPRVWLRELVARVQPPLEMMADPARDDLPGEVARLANGLEKDSEALEALARKALGPLFDNPRYRPLLSPPDPAALERLLLAAQRTCLDMLENR